MKVIMTLLLLAAGTLSCLLMLSWAFPVLGAAAPMLGAASILCAILACILTEHDRDQHSVDVRDDWRLACEALIRNAYDLLEAAGEGTAFIKLRMVIGSAPGHPRFAKEETWQSESFCAQCLAIAAANKRLPRESFRRLHDYFCNHLPRLSPARKRLLLECVEGLLLGEHPPVGRRLLTPEVTS